MRDALLVFTDVGHWFERFMKPGFGHVVAYVRTDRGWVSYDWKGTGYPSFTIEAPADFDLASYYRSEGITVVETFRQYRPYQPPLMVNNCVGHAKLALGIRSRALTPYQLYKSVR